MGERATGLFIASAQTQVSVILIQLKEKKKKKQRPWTEKHRTNAVKP